MVRSTSFKNSKIVQTKGGFISNVILNVSYTDPTKIMNHAFHFDLK